MTRPLQTGATHGLVQLPILGFGGGHTLAVFPFSRLFFSGFLFLYSLGQCCQANRCRPATSTSTNVEAQHQLRLQLAGLLERGHNAGFAVRLYSRSTCFEGLGFDAHSFKHLASLREGSTNWFDAVEEQEPPREDANKALERLLTVRSHSP